MPWLLSPARRCELIAAIGRSGLLKMGKRNPDFAATWSDLWLAIKSRQLNRIDLKGTLSDAEAEKEALFYSREKNAAVVFDTEIIPFRDGYPCQHEDDAYRGYFVAATTLRQSPDRRRQKSKCL